MTATQPTSTTVPTNPKSFHQQQERQESASHNHHHHHRPVHRLNQAASAVCHRKTVSDMTPAVMAQRELLHEEEEEQAQRAWMNNGSVDNMMVTTRLAQQHQQPQHEQPTTWRLDEKDKMTSLSITPPPSPNSLSAQNSRFRSLWPSRRAVHLSNDRSSTSRSSNSNNNSNNDGCRGPGSLYSVSPSERQRLSPSPLPPTSLPLMDMQEHDYHTHNMYDADVAAKPVTFLPYHLRRQQLPVPPPLVDSSAPRPIPPPSSLLTMPTLLPDEPAMMMRNHGIDHSSKGSSGNRNRVDSPHRQPHQQHRRRREHERAWHSDVSDWMTPPLREQQQQSQGRNTGIWPAVSITDRFQQQQYCSVPITVDALGQHNPMPTDSPHATASTMEDDHDNHHICNSIKNPLDPALVAGHSSVAEVVLTPVRRTTSTKARSYWQRLLPLRHQHDHHRTSSQDHSAGSYSITSNSRASSSPTSEATEQQQQQHLQQHDSHLPHLQQLSAAAADDKNKDVSPVETSNVTMSPSRRLIEHHAVSKRHQDRVRMRDGVDADDDDDAAAADDDAAEPNFPIPDLFSSTRLAQLESQNHHQGSATPHDRSFHHPATTGLSSVALARTLWDSSMELVTWAQHHTVVAALVLFWVFSLPSILAWMMLVLLPLVYHIWAGIVRAEHLNPHFGTGRGGNTYTVFDSTTVSIQEWLRYFHTQMYFFWYGQGRQSNRRAVILTTGIVLQQYRRHYETKGTTTTTSSSIPKRHQRTKRQRE